MFGLIARLVSLALVAATVAGGLALTGSGFMVMLPALLLLVPLLCGRYVGERRIHRIRRSLVASRLRPTHRTVPASVRTGHALLHRGGLLIAASIAVRPPPTAA